MVKSDYKVTFLVITSDTSCHKILKIGTSNINAIITVSGKWNSLFYKALRCAKDAVGTANCVDSDQTERSRLIWVCTPQADLSFPVFRFYEYCNFLNFNP